MIVAVPKKSLTTSQKTKLSKKGFIIIECDDPSKIRVIEPEVNINTDAYFMAALFGLTCNTPISKQEHFVNDLYNRLNKKQ